MSAGTGVRPCCSMCLIVPDDPGALRKRLAYVDYWLCVNRAACLDRATAQQHQARMAEEAVWRAIAIEKAALEADVAEVKAALQAGPEGRHAATGPLQVLTDTVVADIASLAAKASTETDAPDEAGEVSHD